MLSNIKTYQSETASQRSSSQNSPSCCIPGFLLTKESLLIWLVAARSVYIHAKYSGFTD